MGTALISNPPYNMKWTLPPFAQLQERFCNCELPPESNANYAFILTALQMIDNKAVFLLPGNVLTTKNRQEEAIRKYLVDKNLIEAVIACPDRMFESTSIATCIIVFNKKKETTNISFVDMRKTYNIEQREQKGQFGGASHENRVYKKEVKTFSDENMQKAINSIKNQLTIPEYSKTVSVRNVIENNYILNTDVYIDFRVEDVEHRKYEDIIGDLNRVISEKNGLKLTINESLAKAIGVYDVFLLFKQSEETSGAINSVLANIGESVEKENFIAISKKAGELRFENGRRDKVSTILLSIMSLWKQHVMYLNEEENRYLAELRDALLPDLMSGKIQLNDGEMSE